MTRFIVHSLDHAKAALEAAESLDAEVTLLSPPFGASSLGPAYFREMVEQAARAHPRAKYTAVLDCGTEPGYALKALREGVGTVRLEATEEVLAKVRQCGAAIEGEIGAALDLEGRWNALDACRAAISSQRS